MAFVFLYVTTSSQKEAERIAKALLEEKLIACVNILPSISLYRWIGKIEKKREYILLLKTKEKYSTKIKEEIKKIHSYEIPCITKIKVLPNKEFANWIEKEVK